MHTYVSMVSCIDINNLKLPAIKYATSVCVKDFTTLADGSKSPASKCKHLAPGSFLISINGVSVLTYEFDQTIKSLIQAARPCVLRFSVRCNSLFNRHRVKTAIFPPPSLSLSLFLSLA